MNTPNCPNEIEGVRKNWTSLKNRIRIRPMVDDDLTPVHSHLIQHFCRDEFTLGLFPFSQELTSDLRWILEELSKDGLCFLAEDKETLEILGVMCNYIQPSDVEKLPFDRLQSQAMRINFGLNLVAVRNSGFWNIIPDSEYVHVFALSVHPDWRRQGLGTLLGREAFKAICSLDNIPQNVASMFTSPYSRIIAQRMGFQVMPDSEVKYSTLTWQGGPVFKTQEMVTKVEGQSCEILWADVNNIKIQ